MKKAKVYMHDSWAGILQETEVGYQFEYKKEYLEQKEPEAISLTLPLIKTPYESKVLFPFFDGLIPEGWLLEIVENNWKLNAKDRMAILLATCADCIGAVSIIPE